MTFPRSPELKILPLHIQTPLAHILMTWPTKPNKCVILLTCCRLLEFVVGLPKGRRNIHTRIVGVYLLLRMWLEHFTGDFDGSCHLYRNRLYCVCDTLRIVTQWLVLHSTFSVALKLHMTGTCAKTQRKQDIALSAENRKISVDKDPPEMTGLKSTAHLNRFTKGIREKM